jgi:hypothetical protein
MVIGWFYNMPFGYETWIEVERHSYVEHIDSFTLFL